ncbi:hypothetical protein M5D96_009160, partial [Drosophila gunungcola]
REINFRSLRSTPVFSPSSIRHYFSKGNCSCISLLQFPFLLVAHFAGFLCFFAFHVAGAICHRSAAIYRSRLLRIMATSTRVTLSCSITNRG